MDYHSIEELIRRFWLGVEEDNKLELGDDFDKLMMDKIMNLEKKSTRGNAKKKIWPYIMAAGIALLVGLTLINKLQDNDKAINIDPVAVNEEFIDTYDDPQEAYENVRAALMMVSSNLNEGVSYTSEMNKFEQAQKEISKIKK